MVIFRWHNIDVRLDTKTGIKMIKDGRRCPKKRVRGKKEREKTKTKKKSRLKLEANIWIDPVI